MMARIISKCPGCAGMLHITTLRCPDCGMEIKQDYSLSHFEKLTDEEFCFLTAFLRQRGNLKNVQNELGISYPTAKKRLDELLIRLQLAEPDEEELDMTEISGLSVDRTSTKASEIIKAKLKDNGGRVIVHSARGLPCEIVAHPDGKSFTSKKLPIKPP